VIILTSNLGFDYDKQGQGLGFSRETVSEDFNRLRDRMINSAKQIFKPELLNRFDDVVVFKRLDRADIIQILEVELAKLRKRLDTKAITLELDKDATDLLVSKGFDPTLGARPLRRTIERMIEDPLAEQLLSGDFAGSTIVGSPAEDKQTLSFKEKKHKASQKRAKKRAKKK